MKRNEANIGPGSFFVIFLFCYANVDEVQSNNKVKQRNNIIFVLKKVIFQNFTNSIQISFLNFFSHTF